MTVRLAAALREHRHLRAARVICQRDGSPLTQDMVADHVGRAAKRAGLNTSGVHRLRHSFCSHLAMRGAPARAIQELAGHQDLITTQRYMHLSPAAIDSQVRLNADTTYGTVRLKPDTTYDQRADDQRVDQSLGVERYWRRQISNPLSPILSVI